MIPLENLYGSKWDWLIAFIIAIGLVSGIIYTAARQKDRIYKFISPYGVQYFKESEGRPYMDYQVHFQKVDTEIYIVNKQAYKIVEVKTK